MQSPVYFKASLLKLLKRQLYSDLDILPFNLHTLSLYWLPTFFFLQFSSSNVIYHLVARGVLNRGRDVRGGQAEGSIGHCWDTLGGGGGGGGGVDK